eukprot:8205987-Pyramimonas_sp.AAC.1
MRGGLRYTGGVPLISTPGSGTEGRHRGGSVTQRGHAQVCVSCTMRYVLCVSDSRRSGRGRHKRAR